MSPHYARSMIVNIAGMGKNISQNEVVSYGRIVVRCNYMTTRLLLRKIQRLENALLDLRRPAGRRRARQTGAHEAREITRAWKEATATLRSKLPKNPVAWQRKTRAEWR